MKVSNAEEEEGEEKVDNERGHWSIVILHVQLTTAFGKCFLFSISSSSTSLPFSCHLLQLFLFCRPSLLAPFLTSWTHHYCLCHTAIIIIIIIVVIIVIVVIIIIERRCTRRQCPNSQPTLS